ncbi:MAG: hypothetical protein K2J27_01030 [Duncaniella sp.]|nr:hypothetical protein [Duncaniella sp.]
MKIFLTAIALILFSANFCVTNAQNTYWTEEGNYDTSWYDETKNEYHIGNARELAGLAVLSAIPSIDYESGGLEGPNKYFQNKTIKLTSDIDLSGHLWLPMELNGAVFDGDGYTISGMTIHITQGTTSQSYGFCSLCNTIKNLVIGENSEIVIPSGITVDYVGGIGGICNDIDNCINNAVINVTRAIETDLSIGGIVGYAYEITDCVNNGSITVFSRSGSIGGIMGGSGNVSGHRKVDGCINNGYISITNSLEDNGYSIAVAGITPNYGNERAVVINCGNTGNISLEGYSTNYGSSMISAFGISQYTPAKNCYNTGILKVKGSNGNSASNIVAYDCENCYSTAGITVENVSNFDVWSSSYKFGINQSKFCYLSPDVIGITGATVIDNMKSQEFCDLLNRNLSEIKYVGLRQWILGENGYPVISHGDDNSGIDDVYFDIPRKLNGIYLLDGRRVNDISNLSDGQIYIKDGVKYIKRSNY